MFSCCSNCGSDYCGGECVERKYAPLVKFVKDIAENGTYGDPENYKDEAIGLVKNLQEIKA